MLSVEYLFDDDLVNWFVVEYSEGKRYEMDSGYADTFEDAHYWAGESLARFVPLSALR